MAAVHILISLSRIIVTIFKLHVSFIPIVETTYSRTRNFRHIQENIRRKLKIFEKEFLETQF